MVQPNNALHPTPNGGAKENKMELDKWTASSVPNPRGELFNAIITGHAGRQLIAQCTTLEFAEHIVDLHNRAAESRLASEHPKSDVSKAHPADLATCLACGNVSPIVYACEQCGHTWDGSACGLPLPLLDKKDAEIANLKARIAALVALDGLAHLIQICDQLDGEDAQAAKTATQRRHRLIYTRREK